MEAETVPGLQSVSGPGTHTQSPVWGSQEWFGGHEQVWAQLGPNVPVGHTTNTDIWQMIKTWSVEKSLVQYKNILLTKNAFQHHIQEIWTQAP